MKKLILLLILFIYISGCAAYNPPPGPPGKCISKHTEQGLFGTLYYLRIEPNNDKYETWDYQVDGVTYDRWSEGDILYWPNYKGSYYK